MTEPNAILTVCLNAAVDVSCIGRNFQAGQTNTVEPVARVAGGKGNNVARVLASLGQPVIATGFVGGETGRFIVDDLTRSGVEADFEPIDAPNRTWTSIADPDTERVTGVREPGPSLSADDADRFYQRFSRLLDRAGLVILSGSLPPGIPAAFYAELISLAYRKTQVRTMLDASGEVLREVGRAQPYLAKPNLHELEVWAGRSLPDDMAVLQAAGALIESGPLIAGVSLGPEGLILAAPEGAWKATPPQVRTVNTTGSGDALLAGFAAGLMQGLPAEEILQLAVACGTANAVNESVGLVRPDDLQRIRPLVTVNRIA